MRVQEPLLGTRGEVVVSAPDSSLAEHLERSVLAEVERLESIFSVFDPASALHALRHTGTTNVAELRDVQRLAGQWTTKTQNVFNPAMKPLYDLWEDAADAQVVPTNVDCQERALECEIDATRNLDLNGVAKGWIADRALEIAFSVSEPVSAAWLSLGGDLVHRGAESVLIGIEDPRRPYDNVAPMATVEVSNEALATSGTARRWWTIDGQRFSKVLDPRTGWPASGVASATVIAASAAAADVLATTALLLDPKETLSLVAREQADCWLVLDDGSVVSSSVRFTRA